MGYHKENDFLFDKKGRLRNFEKHSFLVEEKGEGLIVILGIDITKRRFLKQSLMILLIKTVLLG
jgi:hypothetical protein